MQNCKTLRQPLLGELAMSPEERERERKREREKMPFIVATYVYASSQGQRTHSALTNLREIRLGRSPFFVGACETETLSKSCVNLYEQEKSIYQVFFIVAETRSGST